MRRPEQEFQIKLVRDLRKVLPSDCFMTCFPAGGGGKMRGIFLKSMGLVPGFCDLLFVHRGVAFGMELKAGKETLSETQRDTHAALGRAGMDVRVVRSLDEAMAALAAFGIPTRIVHEQARAA